MAKLKISDDLQNIIKQVVLDTYYPIGKTYITMGSEDPNKTIGGTWIKISGGYIYAAAKTLGQTSFYGWGAQSTILTVDQIPPHTHSYYGHYGYNREARSTLGWNLGDTDYNDYRVSTTGGGKGHTHDIATVDVFMWKRTA